MPISDDLFLKTIIGLLEMIIDLQTHLTATQLALEKAGALNAAVVEKHRQALLPRSKDVREKLAKARPDTILEMLRRFQGPPQ
jgi:hypothetical protein